MACATAFELVPKYTACVSALVPAIQTPPPVELAMSGASAVTRPSSAGLRTKVHRPAAGSRDEWERRLRRVATDCGVSLPDAALSSEGIYE